MMIKVLLLALFSYLLGAVPTGYLIARKAMGIDIREHGSGNPGAANVYRTVGKWAGISTFLIDGLKGLACICIFLHHMPSLFLHSHSPCRSESACRPHHSTFR